MYPPLSHIVSANLSWQTFASDRSHVGSATEHMVGSEDPGSGRTRSPRLTVGRDLLVRHEKTLHADAWAKAQETVVAGDATSRTGRRRQSRVGWDNVPNAPQPEAESHYGMHINDETVIRFESFLPSPRVSSSSDISDPEPVSGGTDGFHFDFPLDPSLANAVDMITGGLECHGDQIVQHHGSFDAQMQTGDPNHFHDDQAFPLDPSLTSDATTSEELSAPFANSNSDQLNFFSLFPGSEVDKTAFSTYINGLQSQATTPESLRRAMSGGNYFSSTEFLAKGPATPPAPADRVSTLRERLPRLTKGGKSSPPRNLLGDDARKVLIADLQKRLCSEEITIEIPTSQSLQRFLHQFFKAFNSHLPIFHIPSFDVAKTPGPLILAMCSIGALFHLERDVASGLRELADAALQKTQTIGSSREYPEVRPLWEVQCRLLLIVEAAFGGGCVGVGWALENLGFFHREFSLRRASLSSASGSHGPETWGDWIERESSKRLLFGMFIISSLLTIAYNVSPCMSTTDDLKIEMPEEERVWTAADEQHWKEAMATRTSSIGTEINQALTQLLFGKEFNPGSEAQWPAFATTILMHAVNVHMWHVTQCTQSFMNFAVDPKVEEQMKALCTTQTEESLARCHQVLSRDRSTEAGNMWDDSDGPLLFNGMALLRSCYVRAFTGSGTFNRTMLFSNNDDDIVQAAKDYVQIQQVRTPFLTRAVAQVFTGLLTPIRAGHLLVKKTAAFTWSIEHAMAAWDCGRH